MSDEAFVETIPPHLQALMTRLNAYAKTQTGQTRRIEEDELFPSLEAKDFRLKRVIGRGGMGTVYIADQISLDRQVAVKVLASDLVKNEKDRAQFEREAKLIAVLHHPGIIKILSAGEVNGRCFYAMELINGPSLDKVPFRSLKHLATIGGKIADALAYAHQCNVLHRDIKPANIFLDAHENIHLGDFGIAYSIRGHHVIFDAEGVPSGTPEYIAPERLSRGENTVRADIYSFGITLRELARQSKLTLDHDFEAIIAMCINEEPSQRYGAIADVAKDLRRYLAHYPVEATHPGLFRRASLWGRRNPIYGLLLGLLLLGTFIWGIDASIDTAQRLQARRELAHLSIPTQREYHTKDERALRRTLDIAERILGRYPDDPEIVAKTLTLYDDYIDLHRQGKRSMYIAFRETDRIISTLGILFWNPNISNSIKERLLELQLTRLETPTGWRNNDDTQWLKEKIRVELDHYDGPKRDAFLLRLENAPSATENIRSPEFEGTRNPRVNAPRDGQRQNRFNPRSSHLNAPAFAPTTQSTQKDGERLH